MRPSVRAQVFRRAGQCFFLILFLFLFIKTDYAGRDELPQSVNLLFRIDPFLALASMLAARMLLAVMFPSLVTVALTFLFGRFFCGWICPMGTLIDGSHRLLGGRGRGNGPGQRQWKYYLLFFLLASSLCGLPAAGYADPFSLLVRGLALAVHPALGYGATSFFTWTYQHLPTWLNAFTEPVYAVLKAHVLPFADKVYGLSVFSFLLLLAVLGLGAVERRFFCRKLCPLGALLSLVSRFSAFSLTREGEGCGKCRQCSGICRMGAIDEERAVDTGECTLCLDCLDSCPRAHFGYGIRRRAAAKPAAAKPAAVGLSRRAVLSSLAAGVLLPLTLPVRPLARNADPRLIRPPGALAEADFLGRCVRCGECMKVCIGNALQPVWLEAGLEGIFTPRLVGRIGYCEYNCTLCGQVCPTGAIKKLTKAEKQTTVIGRAYFDKNRCLPYAAGTPCIVCEEHCPTPEKAIQFRELAVIDARGRQVVVRQPFIVKELCIGCGICENKCPLTGGAAVMVTAEGESRGSGGSFTQDGY
jgi:polyferredoxin